MLRELTRGCLMMLVMTAITGLAYPMAVTAIAYVAFPDQATGSLIRVNGRVVGSRLIGQNFTRPEYFHPRPSAAGSGYDAASSAGSNLGPTSEKLVTTIRDRLIAYADENDIAYEKTGQYGFTTDTSIPADAVTASASGLDPHISPANAALQAARVARARGVAPDRVTALVAAHRENPTFGFLGEPRINVLELNLALDHEIPVR